MLFVLPTLVNILLLLLACQVMLGGLNDFSDGIQQLKQTSQQQRTREVCAQLLASKQNIEDASYYLQTFHAREGTSYRQLSQEFIRQLDKIEQTLPCQSLRNLAMRPSKRKVKHPELHPLWPNWIAAFE